MLKKLLITFQVLVILSLLLSSSNAEILKPNSDIKPSEVVKTQLSGLQKNDLNYKDSGIEQTWEFAHPNNRSITGPLDRFKIMLKSKSYKILLDHLDHEVIEEKLTNSVALFEVRVLGVDKAYYSFKWQVEKFIKEGPLKDCWLTTMVSTPMPLGSSI